MTPLHVKSSKDVELYSFPNSDMSANDTTNMILLTALLNFNTSSMSYTKLQARPEKEKLVPY